MSSPAPHAVVTNGATLTRRQLDADVFGLRSQVQPCGSAVLSTSDAGVVAAALISLDGWAEEVRVVPPGSPVADTDTAVRLEADREAAATAPSSPAGHESAPAVTTRWVIYTSGTTGEPKPISHTTASLTRTVATRASDHIWGLTYDPNRMAGLQVILQTLASDAMLIAPSIESPISARLAMLVEHGVTAVSATPSVWRQVLQLPSHRELPLRQITLGGEIADQRVLDALRNAYPDARIVHVFASTETGAAFSVGDGREGFPVAFLSDPPRGIHLAIRDDILHVFSPGVSVAGRDGYASTGDTVEVVGDRVMFRGRASGVVNIGGSNVWPEAVESILRSHPEVTEAVVTSRPNPMLGNVLVAAVTVTDAVDRDTVTKELRAWVRDRAPRTHVPASVTVHDDLALASTGKVIR